MTAALLLIAIVLAMLALRQPLVSMLLVAIGYAHMVWGSGRLEYVIEDMWVSLEKETLLAIPMFLLCGGVMTRGSTARRLVRIAAALTRQIPGGLAIACILASMVFAAISGSSIVTMLAVGGVMLPALKEAGYTSRFALGVVLAGGSLGVVLPPSIPLIIFGFLTETSLTELFVAGLLPGLLLVVLFALYSLWVCRHIPTQRFSWRELWDALRHGWLAALMPVILLGGIYSGYFSPTESAAVALMYALVIEVFVHKDMKLSEMRNVVVDAVKTSGSLFPLFAVALSLALLLTEHRVPDALVQLMQGWFSGPVSFMVAVNILLFVVSCVMTTTEALLILGPLLTPVAVSFGYDKAFFGVVMIHNLEIGFLVPPLGMNLLVAMTAFKQRLGDLALAAVPWIVLMVIGLAIIIWQPGIAMYLVNGKW
ncbi:TRAP transporter large permease [Alicycliphilus sp. T452]